MKELFESKEQYINFRNSWKDYINSGKAKKERKQVKQWNGKMATVVTPSPLSSEYHLFYALARGKDNDGFVDPSDGLTEAYQKLSYISLERLYMIFGNAVNEDFINKVKKLSTA